MKSQAKSVDEYLAELPADRRAALQTLRTIVKAVAPHAVESMQYGMATYTLGEMFCALASQKNYLAIYGCGSVVERHRARLGKLDCGKGCIRFRHLEELPLDVVATMLEEVAALRLRTATRLHPA